MYSSPTQPSLSSSIWSKDHWRFLDSILQSWKPENQSSPDSEGKRRRNSTRVISKLLGKNVYAQGEKMKLEQWHLEVVDEFRGYVPGWEEAVVAKRVFALIVGEERRALGLIGGGTEYQAEV
jgi:serine/arginine repetitive matrix protein 2